MDDRNGMGPQGGYIGRITNDAREEEMEENMGQVNTMIGNLRNMAIDMGSELENQNRQIDRINLKVRGSATNIYRNLRLVCLLYACSKNKCSLPAASTSHELQIFIKLLTIYYRLLIVVFALEKCRRDYWTLDNQWNYDYLIK